MKEHKINTWRNRIQLTLNTPLVLNEIRIFLIPGIYFNFRSVSHYKSQIQMWTIITIHV